VTTLSISIVSSLKWLSSVALDSGWQANHAILGEGSTVSIMMCQPWQSPHQPPPPLGRNLTTAVNILSTDTSSEILGLCSLSGKLTLTSMALGKFDTKIIIWFFVSSKSMLYRLRCVRRFGLTEHFSSEDIPR
jgi:hypothetical protein